MTHQHPNPDRGTLLTLYLCHEGYESAIMAAGGRVMWWGVQDDNPHALLSCPRCENVDLVYRGADPHCTPCDRTLRHGPYRPRQLCPLCRSGVNPHTPKQFGVVECHKCDWTGARHPATRKP